MDEMTKPAISVLVPVYNVERYLSKCLDSIAAQTFGDFECVIIDDCTPDESMAVAQTYIDADPRFRAVRHECNMGLAGARNTGIAAARADLIAFVDSDDWVAPDYLSFLLDIMRQHDADVSVCGRYYAYEEEGGIRPVVDHAPAFADRRLSGAEALRAINSYDSFDVSMWAKLFKKKSFAHMSFPVGKNSEDFFLAPRLMLNAKGVAYDPRPLYYYRSRIGSISNGAKINRDGLAAAKEQLSFIEEVCPALRWVGVSAVAVSCIDIANGYVDRGMAMDTEEMERLHAYCRNELWPVLRNPDLPRLKKAQVACFATSAGLYARLFRALKARSEGRS